MTRVGSAEQERPLVAAYHSNVSSSGIDIVHEQSSFPSVSSRSRLPSVIEYDGDEEPRNHLRDRVASRCSSVSDLDEEEKSSVADSNSHATLSNTESSDRLRTQSPGGMLHESAQDVSVVDDSDDGDEGHASDVESITMAAHAQDEDCVDTNSSVPAGTNSHPSPAGALFGQHPQSVASSLSRQETAEVVAFSDDDQNEGGRAAMSLSGVDTLSRGGGLRQRDYLLTPTVRSPNDARVRTHHASEERAFLNEC